MQLKTPHELEKLSASHSRSGELNPWHQYKGWKIWNVPDSQYFVCVREDAGKVLEVNKTLPISTIVRTIELALDDREKTPTATWQQIRQILAESKAAFWENLLEVARKKEELRHWLLTTDTETHIRQTDGVKTTASPTPETNKLGEVTLPNSTT